MTATQVELTVVVAGCLLGALGAYGVIDLGPEIGARLRRMRPLMLVGAFAGVGALVLEFLG